MTTPETQLENLRDRIESSHKIDDGDRESIREFDDALTLMKSNYSTYRHLKLLRHVTILAERVGGVNAALTDKEAAKNIVRWIHRNYDNEETNQDYRVALKVFGRHVSDEGVGGDPYEPPASLDWIQSSTSNNYDPAPKPSDMLDWHDDILPMIEATEHARDAAAIALQFDAGLRGFEFKDLTYGDVTDHEHGLQVTADGKQGRRTVLLIPSVPYVRDWLDEHPTPSDRDAPLWSKLTEGEKISYRMLTKVFKKPAARAEVDKPVTLTNFRKSSASYHASKGLSQAHLESRYGWVRGSTTASRYITIFGEDADNELAKLHGLEVNEGETQHIGPVDCPRCGYQEKREAHFCSRCGQAMRVEAAGKTEDLQDDIKYDYADTDPDDISTQEGIETIDALLDDPDVKSALLERMGATE
ncbi:tyrosine-type recombinase/integrase [Halobaculum rarum]|uniref:tyrosine-type recombinase/integrase n=1 Tax=Halobaculum rarum TaxID=3075122 RepID=UPI0032AF7530